MQSEFGIVRGFIISEKVTMDLIDIDHKTN
jgi:hypothetical protein